MNTRILAILATLPLAASIAQAGSPLIRLNDDASSNIMFTAEAVASYNDNIFYQQNKSADTIFTVTPGLELNVGGDGNSKFKMTAKGIFSSYSDYSEVNTQLGVLDALYTYDAHAAFKARVGAGIAEMAQPTTQTAASGDVIRSTAINGLAMGEYKLTEKSTIETGVKYNGIRYTNGFESTYNDQDSYSIPATWLYAVTEKLNAGLTYQYTFTDLSKASATTASEPGQQSIHFVGLTARGLVTEKLQLNADAGVGRISVRERALALGGEFDDTTFNFGLSATYTITEKLSAIISGNRSFSAGAEAQAITTTRGNIGLNYSISEAWSAGAYTGLSNEKYDTLSREDDIFTAGANVTYLINKYWRTTLSYAYLNDDSSAPGVSFNNNIIALSASVKY